MLAVKRTRIPLSRLPLFLLAAAVASPGALPAQSGKAPPADRDAVPFTQSRPPYPESLRSYRIRGEVRLAYDVDAAGYVQNVRALYATHPDFLQPALTVAQGWRFRPARKGGQPIATSREESVFSDVATPGLEPFEIPFVPAKDLPDQYRYDRPPAIRTLVKVVYPYQELLANKRGSAQVAFVVGPDGYVGETRVRSASEPAFGLALAAAMEAWEFEPALKSGQPGYAVLGRGQEFKQDGEDGLVSEGTRRLLRILSAEQPAIVPMAELDASPAHLERIAPVFPAKLAGKNGSAEIEFLVDREGAVHLPRILKASEPEFGWAAATAVNRWRFAPPLKGGQPVDARFQIQLDFRGAPATPPTPDPDPADGNTPAPAGTPPPA